MSDLVERLRASVTQARAVDRSALLAEAADEIKRLRGRPASSDIVTRLRQTRANMLGTDDEAHYWDCHDAAAEIERLRNRSWPTMRYVRGVTESMPKEKRAEVSFTDAEREALEIAVEYVGSAYAVEHHAKTIQRLLERMQYSDPGGHRPH